VVWNPQPSEAVEQAQIDGGQLDRWLDPAIFRLREPAWAEIVPFLQFDLDIRIANMSSSTPA
jgi:hypothetical protein